MESFPKLHPKLDVEMSDDIFHSYNKKFNVQCARSALRAVIGDISNASFVANAPMAHLALQQNEGMSDSQTLKVILKTFNSLQSTGLC